MTVTRTTVYATTSAVALPKQPSAPAGEACRARPAPVVRDLRERAGHSPHGLRFGPRDLVVVTGLPGSGKSTLMRRAVTADGVRVDSQDTRDRWDTRTAGFLPYAVYRPLVRLAHYAGLHRALRSASGAVVHDCGTQTWVRGWLARAAGRRGGTLHLVFLDVTPDTALDGQRERGRGVSRYAFLRHRRAAARLLRSVERGELPHGVGSAVLLDRDAADVLRRIDFAD
ncbi:AAA family ATPase [Streptomyces sp. NPDC010273]|uniref:AAA family ATPase n=1 Tax=Streptomyces sp. NPDC010273 TaxID=3364829 RepID=UPI0036E8C3FD